MIPGNLPENISGTLYCSREGTTSYTQRNVFGITYIGQNISFHRIFRISSSLLVEYDKLY